MSLWWARREQLDDDQISLIEKLPLDESFLVTGPPGCGKTNVLLRRAQFVRGQEMPNVLVLTFTRALTEFVRTGCLDPEGREIFPRACVTTLETWIEGLYREHNEDLPTRPDNQTDLSAWKRRLAENARGFSQRGRLPRYDALFVDEAQDLLPEEVDLLSEWSHILFFVGDNNQKLYESDGLAAVRRVIDASHERTLQFHYRLADEICAVADRILVPAGGTPLASSCHYKGPRPGRADPSGPLSEEDQLKLAAERLADQIRVYADLIRDGDRLGVIVARKDDRERVLDYLNSDGVLPGRAQIIRARNENEHDFQPAFQPDVPISILTIHGSKGLEFRAVHWLFCERLDRYHRAEHYYTMVTRAKTSLDVYYSGNLPRILAGSMPRATQPW